MRAIESNFGTETKGRKVAYCKAKYMSEENRGWEVKHAPAFQGKTTQDFLYFEGMYNPLARFAFTNVLDEDFVSYWNSRQYTIKPHQTVKLQHHLACKFTKEIVDRMMTRDKIEKNMAVPLARKPYEDKVLSLLPNAEDDFELQVIRDSFVEQVRHDAEKQVGVIEEEYAFPTLNADKAQGYTNPELIATGNQQLRNQTNVSVESHATIEPVEKPKTVRRGRPPKQT